MLSDYINPISTITASQFIEANKADYVRRRLPDEPPTMDRAIDIARKMEDDCKGKVKFDPAFVLEVWMNK